MSKIGVRTAERAIRPVAMPSDRRVRGSMMAAAIGVLLASAPASIASPIQYDFSGAITSAPESSGIAAGTPFSGSFWYDLSQGVIFETEGSYSYGGPDSSRPNYSPDSAGISLNIGGWNQANASGEFSIAVQYTPMYGPSDPTAPSTKVTVTNGGQATSPLTLTFTNPGRMMTPSLTVPGTLSLSDFTTAQLDYIQKTTSGNLEFQGTITAMTAVPEPAHATIICLVVGWLVHVRRTRKGRAAPPPIEP